MGIYDSKLWFSDINEIIENLSALDCLEGYSVMVTGCTGLICSAIVDVLIQWNNTHIGKIKILAAGRSEDKVAKRYAPFFHEDWFNYIYFDACSANLELSLPCDYIIHGASNASPNNIMREPVETMVSNFIGTKCLLDFARNNNVKRLLLISSSEVYGKRENNTPSKTDDYGWIDILSPRSSYSIGKCAAETLCVSYHYEYGVDTVIVRPGHIYGPTATETDNRVSSQWAYDVARGNDIIMKSEGLQVRSYCYCLDCASAVLIAMLKGKSVSSYNISNPKSIITIKELAEILIQTAGVNLKIEIPDEADRKGFNPMTNSSLDSADLLALGWNGIFDAERGLSHTVNILKETKVD